jgi:hypothetical protein
MRRLLLPALLATAVLVSSTGAYVVWGNLTSIIWGS